MSHVTLFFANCTTNLYSLNLWCSTQQSQDLHYGAHHWIIIWINSSMPWSIIHRNLSEVNNKRLCIHLGLCMCVKHELQISAQFLAFQRSWHSALVSRGYIESPSSLWRFSSQFMSSTALSLSLVFPVEMKEIVMRLFGQRHSFLYLSGSSQGSQLNSFSFTVLLYSLANLMGHHDHTVKYKASITT